MIFCCALAGMEFTGCVYSLRSGAVLIFKTAFVHVQYVEILFGTFEFLQTLWTEILGHWYTISSAILATVCSVVDGDIIRSIHQRPCVMIWWSSCCHSRRRVRDDGGVEFNRIASDRTQQKLMTSVWTGKDLGPGMVNGEWRMVNGEWWMMILRWKMKYLGR